MAVNTPITKTRQEVREKSNAPQKGHSAATWTVFTAALTLLCMAVTYLHHTQQRANREQQVMLLANLAETQLEQALTSNKPQATQQIIGKLVASDTIAAATIIPLKQQVPQDPDAITITLSNDSGHTVATLWVMPAHSNPLLTAAPTFIVIFAALAVLIWLCSRLLLSLPNRRNMHATLEVASPLKQNPADVSEQQENDQWLKLQNFALNQAPDSIVTINAFGQILSVNDTTCSRFGYRRDELVGKNIETLNRDLSRADWHRWWRKHKSQPHQVTRTYNTSKNGERIFVEVSSGYFIYDNEELCVMTLRDITERAEQDEQIKHLAYHDPLTGLPNRSMMQDRLVQALASAKRHSQVGAVLFIDLDNFKKINDSLGHPAGDVVLKELSERYTSHLRAEDTVARLGGDEFVIILSNLGEDEDFALVKAKDLAQKLLNIAARPFMVAEHELHVTASIGMVIFPGNYKSADEILQFADTAMYQAKSDGRDTISVFSCEMAELANRTLNIESQLRKALQDNEYQIHVQPQNNAKGNISGAETLLRWNSDSSGLVSPTEFVPILENTGMIHDVGEWVLRETCMQLRKWLDQGIWPQDQSISVNISPKQFKAPHFVELVAAIVQETRIPAHCLGLELTEGMVVHDIEEIIARLEQLRALGVRISIDDFGTGYSSLTYLKRLPIDTLKIDRSFVKDIPEDEGAAAIVSTIIKMANQLNMQVIAEGVESRTQLNFLKAQDCNYYQGFYFSRPVSVKTFEEILIHEQQSAGQIANTG